MKPNEIGRIALAVALAAGLALAFALLGHAGRAVFDGSEGAIRGALLALAFLAAVAFLPRLVRRYKPAIMITPQTLRAMLAEHTAVLVDVRDASDFNGESGQIQGARNLPLAELAPRLGELAPWRDRGVVLICRTEKRSTAAARLLAQNGFRNVRVVLGGMEAWRRAEYPLQCGQAHPG
ncbi:MAG: rhodanese-like domain-containing protein [Betaproteobacteria bacterium]|nr:rhodanese-like domain-containing protein [Betaproteobacteria bacterium]